MQWYCQSRHKLQCYGKFYRNSGLNFIETPTGMWMNFFIINKLHVHQVGLESMISPSTLLYKGSTISARVHWQECAWFYPDKFTVFYSEEVNVVIDYNKI